MIYSSTFTLSFFCFVGGINSSFITQPNAFQTVQLGEDVTIECYLPKTDFNTMVWYKQEIGKMPVPIARCYNYLREITFLDGFKNKRFSILADHGIFHLTISATKNEDTAMYFCGVIILNELRFGTGTFLMIKGVRFHMQTVLQKPTVELVYPGDNVTLECIFEIGFSECAEPHRVYWFRHGSGDSHPGIIYTNGNSSDQCKKSSDSGSPTQSCVYELPKKNLSSSDAGAYYCAISTCGVILFGNGTKLNITDNNSTFSLIILILVTTNIISVLLIIIAVACRCKEQNHSPGSPNCKTSLDTHVACDEALNYAALSLTKPLSSRGSRRQQMFKDTMVYSQIKYENSAGDTIKLK
ncbi:putative immune-type receptor 8 [Brachyhypopomus gauderio]|uniref:putative immune-type receptor 8 n=1 Tax=Brachyhypopomus gauderio TaxID=698409 RepID=UPI004041750D